jgi:hypothetical protein
LEHPFGFRPRRPFVGSDKGWSSDYNAGGMPLNVVCPLCRATDVEIVADIPAIVLCMCRCCSTAFTIATPATDHPVSER